MQWGGGGVRATISWRKLQYLACRRSPGLFLGLLSQQVLQQCAGRATIGKMPLFITEEASYRPSVLPLVLSPEVLRVFISIVLRLIVMIILGCLGRGHGWWWRGSSLRPLRRCQRGWWGLCSSYCVAEWGSQRGSLWGSRGLSG